MSLRWNRKKPKQERIETANNDLTALVVNHVASESEAEGSRVSNRNVATAPTMLAAARKVPEYPISAVE